MYTWINYVVFDKPVYNVLYNVSC